MSRFLQAASEPEEDEEEVQQQQQIEKASKNQKKKDKKKKKKQDDDDQFLEEQAKQNIIQATLPPNLPQQEQAPPQVQKQEQKQEQKEQPKEQQPDQEAEDDGKEEEEGTNTTNKDKNKKKKDKKKKAAAEKKAEEPKKEDTKPLSLVARKALEARLLKEAEEKRIREERERFEREEAERIRLIEEEEARKKEEEERKKMEKQKKKEQLIQEGKYKTPKQKQEEERMAKMRAQMGLSSTLEEEIKIDTSNVVKKTKRKPKQNQSQQQQEEVIQKEATSQQQQQQQISQVQLQNGLDDWESLLDQGDPNNQKQIQQIQQQQQQEQSQLQDTQLDAKTKEQQRDQKKLDSKVNKELYSMYMNKGDLRSPICCILGHVDTGKTTLLDKIRNTNVQEGEAGGITQQIGATFFPGKKLQEELKKTQSIYPVDCNIPGLLIIDTPGHESFSNLRSRGSSLCDLAILVIDLMHGLEKQTLESIELLKMRKTPFVIALNKIDSCYEWAKRPMASSYEQLGKQKKTTKQDYDNRKQQIVTQLAEQGFNTCHYWENEDPRSYVSIVPTSGKTGEGIPDLLSVIVKYTSIFLKKKVQVKDQFNCTVLERKVIEGQGTTIDCILVDGVLRQDDQIVIQGFSGPIVTKVKAILTPHPMKEMRVKGEYLHHDVLYASMGLKIAAHGLEESVAGSQIYLANNQEDLQTAIQCLNNDFDVVKNSIKLSPQGVGVAASTLGSLEALLQFLKQSDIPVSYVSVGPVSKDDVMKALKNVILEDPRQRKKEFACMLVFDVKVLAEAKEYAEVNQIKVFEANIIYHLFDQFIAYVKQIQEERKKLEGKDAIFPCILKPIQFFNKKEPIILGCDVEQGILKPGTPICLFEGEKTKIGIVETIESNHKTIKEARPSTGNIAIRLKTDGKLQAGRHFDLDVKFASILTRHSIDMLKKYFKDELTLDEWQLVKDLKTFFKIP